MSDEEKCVICNNYKGLNKALFKRIKTYRSMVLCSNCNDSFIDTNPAIIYFTQKICERIKLIEKKLECMENNFKDYY